MSDEMNVKISEIKAKFIRKEAELVDKYGGNCDGSINKDEGAKLAQILSGELQKKSNQKKLEKESDDVKAIFGLTVTKPAEQTKAAPVALQSTAVSNAGEASKNIYKTPFEEVKARFLEVMQYDEVKNTSNGTTAKEAYKAVAKEFKSKGREYKEAIKQLKDYAKHDFVNMRAQKTRASVQAYDSQGNLVKPENLQYDTSKKVYKREKELTVEQNSGKKDKWAKRAIRNKNTSFLNKAGRYLSGNMSQGKVDDRAVAFGNKAVNIRENVSFTKEDMVKALGKDNPLLKEYTDKQGRTYENVLVATGLITKEDDGKYRVKELSKVVNRAVSITDNTLNDHDNHNESEVQSVLTRLYQALRANGSGEFKTSDLKDSQVRDLVAFLGLGDDRTKLLVARLWQNIWKGAAAGAVSGAAAGAANGSWNLDIQQHQEVDLSFDSLSDDQRAELIRALTAEKDLSGIAVTTDYGKGLTETTIGMLESTAKGIYIAQDQMINGTVVSLLKSIAVGAAAGAGAGAVMGAIETIGSHAREKEILGMVFDCDTTYEEILDTIDNAYSDKNLSPEMKAALKEVAKLGIVTTVDQKTGARKAVLDDNCNVQWSYCQFIEAYNDARGNKILNAAEARGAARAADKFKAQIPDCDPKQTEEEEEEEEKTEDTKPLIRQKENAPVTIKVPETKFRAWADLVKGYNCLQEKEFQKSYVTGKNSQGQKTYTTLANRMVKVLQAIDLSKVTTQDELKQIYSLKTLAAFTDEALRNGIDSAMAKYPQLPIDKAEYIDVVTKPGGVRGNVYVPALYGEPGAEDDGVCTWAENGKVAIITGGRGTASIGEKGSTLPGSKRSERSDDGGKTWKPISNADFDKLQKEGVEVKPWN